MRARRIAADDAVAGEVRIACAGRDVSIERARHDALIERAPRDAVVTRRLRSGRLCFPASFLFLRERRAWDRGFKIVSPLRVCVRTSSRQEIEGVRDLLAASPRESGGG